MAEKVYPDWVQKQKVTGTTVKKDGNNYYLYKHSSKRVPGKKNPVPVDTYIGKITPAGIEKSGSKKVVKRHGGYCKGVRLFTVRGAALPGRMEGTPGRRLAEGA